MDDASIHHRLNELAEEEERLWSSAAEGGLDADASTRLRDLQVELDRCYDLLHQRRARRAAGLDPDEAEARPADIVERYQQ